MYCGTCGSSVSTMDDFCGNCGTKVVNDTPQPVASPSFTPVSPQMVPPSQPQTPYIPTQANYPNFSQPAMMNQPIQKPKKPRELWTKDPKLAFLGSLIIPGFTYFYTERNDRGFMILGAFLILLLISLGFVSVIIYIIQLVNSPVQVESYENHSYVAKV